jgi:hypothetical protein
MDFILREVSGRLRFQFDFPEKPLWAHTHLELLDMNADDDKDLMLGSCYNGPS